MLGINQDSVDSVSKNPVTLYLCDNRIYTATSDSFITACDPLTKGRRHCLPFEVIMARFIGGMRQDMQQAMQPERPYLYKVATSIAMFVHKQRNALSQLSKKFVR